MGAPVVPDEANTAPPDVPLPGLVAPGFVTTPRSMEAASPRSTQSMANPTGPAWSAHTMSARTRAVATANPPAPSVGVLGSSGAAQRPEAIVPKKATEKSIGSLITSPTVDPTSTLALSRVTAHCSTA